MRSQRIVRGGGREGRIFTTTLALADVDTTSTYSYLEGRACPYGQWTNRLWFLESFGAGAFDKSIKEASAALPLLLFHNWESWPIGSATEWSSDGDGLNGVWKLDRSAEAQRAAQLAKDGHLSYLSVGYQPLLSAWEFTDVDSWDPDDAATLDRVTRTEARLVETSCLTTPAFPQAEITLVRSAESTNRPRRHAGGRPALDEWRAWRSTLDPS